MLFGLPPGKGSASTTTGRGIVFPCYYPQVTVAQLEWLWKLKTQTGTDMFPLTIWTWETYVNDIKVSRWNGILVVVLCFQTWIRLLAGGLLLTLSFLFFVNLYLPHNDTWKPKSRKNKNQYNTYENDVKITNVIKVILISAVLRWWCNLVTFGLSQASCFPRFQSLCWAKLS